MLDLGIGDWKLVVGKKNDGFLFISYTPTTIPQLPVPRISSVQTVSSLGIGGGFSNNLRTVKNLIRSAMCVTDRFITNSYQAYTTSFTPIFGSVFNQLNPVLVNTFHTTNKDNEFLYKLIIIN